MANDVESPEVLLRFLEVRPRATVSGAVTALGADENSEKSLVTSASINIARETGSELFQFINTRV